MVSTSMYNRAAMAKRSTEWLEAKVAELSAQVAVDRTKRPRAYYSPAGFCPVCGEWTPLTARYSGKLRKHKTKGDSK